MMTDTAAFPEQLVDTWESTPVALLLVDGAGVIRFSNGAANALFQVDVLTGSNVDILVPGHMKDSHASLRADYLQTPTRRPMGKGRMLHAVRPGGSTFPVEIGLNPYSFADEPFVLCSIVSLEVREALERERETALRTALQSQRLDSLAKLAGGVAHDFNNLLATILGNTTFLRSRPGLDRDQDEALEDVQHAAEQAKELASQMLAYAGGQRVHVERLDVVDELRRMTPLLVSLVGRNIRLSVTVDGHDHLFVELDPLQLRQLLMNLTSNAAHAVADKTVGHIAITLGQRLVMNTEEVPNLPALPDGRYVTIDVADNGEGMDDALKAKLFEPFTSTKGTGRGLGLAACQGIMRSAGGGIYVYSEVGHGTTMQLLLPELASAPASDVETAPTLLEHNRTILVIDDEVSILRFTRRALLAAGYRVLVAESGKEGIRLFNANDVDAVLLDVTMPGMDGSAVFRELQRVRPDVCVVLSSGFSHDNTAAQFAGRKVSAFLQKPYSHQELLDCLDDVLSS